MTGVCQRARAKDRISLHENNRWLASSASMTTAEVSPWDVRRRFDWLALAWQRFPWASWHAPLAMTARARATTTTTTAPAGWCLATPAVDRVFPARRVVLRARRVALRARRAVCPALAVRAM